MVATGLIAFVVSDSFFDIVGNVMDSVLLNYCVDLQRKDKPKAADDKLGDVKLPEPSEKKEEEQEPEAKCCKMCSCCNCLCRALCFDKKKNDGGDNSKVSPAADKSEELI